MDFLKTCNTNAQAIGDFEAVAYQAFSISRDTSASFPARDWNSADDVRAVESELRQDLHLVSTDASRPWIWLFKPTTVEKGSHVPSDLPQVAGFHLHSEHAGSIKASELARPPQRSAGACAAINSMNPPPGGSNKGLQSGGARLAPTHNQANAPDQQQPIDCFALYELFTSSVVALISYFLVKDCNGVALNFRTFVCRTPQQQLSDSHEHVVQQHWLTSVNVHWTSSGTLIVSTAAERRCAFRRLDDVTSPAEQKQLVGTCIRIAPNGILARITSFDDPLDTVTEVFDQRQKKRARITSFEQSIVKWKSAVTRWLGWKGYTLPDLHKNESWVRIRASQSCTSVASGSNLLNYERDLLWPRALCVLLVDTTELSIAQIAAVSPFDEQLTGFQKWFDSTTSTGFKDPFDIAQAWALGKTDREQVTEAQRKAKKAEEDAMRRKEEQSGLFTSSPLNARSGAYGDVQPASGVYPTPPDGIVPGTSVSYGDTPSVTGTVSNIILAPGGGPTPAINLSAPQDDTQGDAPLSQTSPNLVATMDNVHTSGGNDDLFGDMEDDGYEANDIDDADFDFFDAQDDNDVDMMDAPLSPEAKAPKPMPGLPLSSNANTDPQIKEEIPDPITALEDALDTASQPMEELPAREEKAQSETVANSFQSEKQVSIMQKSVTPARNAVPANREPTPPLSPSRVAQVLQPSPPDRKASRTQIRQKATLKSETSFDPLHFNRRMSLADAKYQDGRFSSHHDVEKKDEKHRSPPASGLKSLRDVPLMTKLRYAMGVASATKLPEVAALARADSDDSDMSSETTESSAEEEEEDSGASPAAIVTGFVLPAKRKLPTEGNRTPMSVTSFADSLAPDYQDLHGLQLDDACLSLLDPSPWDWSLSSTTLLSERSIAGSRFDMPALPPPASQLPDTPISQPDLNWDTADDKATNLKDKIAITQIVTDQIVLSTLDLLGEDDCLHCLTERHLSLDSHWHSTIKEVFPGALDCDLTALAAVNEVFPDLPAHAKGQQRAQPPRQSNDGPAMTRSHLYPIHAPYLRVRRAETYWDLLPPAISFWEPLGLSPVGPAKNIVSFCVYPQSQSIRPCLETFMLNVQLAYDSCKFGSHARVETVVEFEGGLVPWKVDADLDPKETFKHLRDVCVQLGKLLAIQHAKIREQQDAKVDAFVIYMIDPVGDAPGLWELCSAFWTLFQAYGQGPVGRSDQLQKPDLVLQVVPIKYIASEEFPVILDPSTYLTLAREVYDRCPPSAPSGDRTALGIYAAPAFQLEESLPRNIPFKLISEPPQDLIRENSYLHVGYAISLDGTWLTAAWTDNCGKSQAVVSYHLGTRMFGEIAQEIWQTTIEIAQARRVQWRICVAKAGAMEKEELETWSQIITRPTSINLFITLLTVDTEPSIRLTPTVTTSTTTTTAPTNTPGSTPQPGVSPDPSAGLTPAATPSGDSAADPSTDPEARLIDVTDETWGVVLAHRLHNSHSTNMFSPAVVSGLLVKRGTTFATSSSTSHLMPDPEPGPIVVAVNILWIGAVGSTRAATSPFPPTDTASTPAASPQEGPRTSTSLNWTPTPQSRATAESLLKEALGQYRALGLLAKLRGMRGTKGGSVPWHVAAALRGVKGVGMVVGGLPR